jgi:hypothetical protein
MWIKSHLGFVNTDFLYSIEEVKDKYGNPYYMGNVKDSHIVHRLYVETNFPELLLGVVVPSTVEEWVYRFFLEDDGSLTVRKDRILAWVVEGKSTTPITIYGLVELGIDYDTKILTVLRTPNGYDDIYEALYTNREEIVDVLRRIDGPRT